jgi:hypothetical protein
MRVQQNPRRYTPFIQAGIERLLRECKQDDELRAGDPDAPYKVIPDYLLDLTAEGNDWIVTGAPIDFVMQAASLSGAVLLDAERRKNRDA